MGSKGVQSRRCSTCWVPVLCGAWALRATDGSNNLLKWCQDNGEYGQKLVAEWAEPDVNMKDVLQATNKKLLWRCSAGCMEDGEPFTWETRLNNRTSTKRAGCPGCSPTAPIDLKKRLGKVAR